MSGIHWGGCPDCGEELDYSDFDDPRCPVCLTPLEDLDGPDEPDPQTPWIDERAIGPVDPTGNTIR